MPTPASSFAAVAALLAGVDAADNDAVEEFYGEAFTACPPRVQALIAEFLVGLSDDPTEDELHALKATISLPAEQLPELEAPSRLTKPRVLAASAGAPPMPRVIDAHIGTRIRRRRMGLHMTEDQLATALGITPRELVQYETGATGLPAAMLHDVSHALNVPVGFFFEDVPGSSSTTPGRRRTGFSENAAPYRAAFGGFAEPQAPPPATDTDDLELLHAYEAISSPADRRRALALVSGLRSARP